MILTVINWVANLLNDIQYGCVERTNSYRTYAQMLILALMSTFGILFCIIETQTTFYYRDICK